MKRPLLYIAACFAVLLAGVLFYSRYFSRVQEEDVSPDGNYKVLVRTSGSLSAMDSDAVFVQITPKWRLERNLLLQISGDNTQVRVRWLHPNELQIICHNCSQAHIDRQEHLWRGVVVDYEMD